MNRRYPTLIIRNLILFPNQEVKIELSNEISKEIIEFAYKNNKGELVVLSPYNNLEITPNIKDLPNIASLGQIKTYLELPNKNYRVILRGIKRVQIKSFIGANGMDTPFTEIMPTTNPVFDIEKENTYVKKLKKLLGKYVNLNSKISNHILEVTKNVTSVSKLSDMITASTDLSYEKRCELFSEIDYYKRAYTLMGILDNEIKSLELENKLDEEIRSNFEKSEKDIVIREKINILKNELTKENGKNEEVDEFLNKVNNLSIGKAIKDNLIREIKRFETTFENSQEYSVLRSHLDFVINLPWNKSSKDCKDILKVDKNLNKMHYGLNEAKHRIEEYLLLKQKNPKIHSPILCLIGPPGTGKTTFARELSKSIGRKFIKISVGGLNDSAELIGHRRTYIGAGPGKIMENIRKCGVNNPIILIDEIDKMVKDYKGDPASTLLEILDQNQNKEFTDNYVGEPFDLSKVLFILTANEEENIPKPLLDRLEIIEVSSYTVFDKIEIAKNYTLPRLGNEYGFDYKKIKLGDKVISKIVNDYTKEAGMRDLERKISSIVRNVLINGLTKEIVITEKDLPNYLGKDKYANYLNSYENSGTVNVPAHTSSGGVLLNIECAIYKGEDVTIATGSLGDIMIESTKVALSYIKSNYKTLQIDLKKLDNSTIHIHALDGASKKDGPSAGLAITTAIISNILNKKVPTDIAFTGEITLSGRILKIGGVKEKLISCYNSNIKKIYIPMENINDLGSVPKKVIKNINIIPVNSFTEVYNDLFN